MLKAQGRDLHAEFIRLLPTPPQPVSIQRWSLRRVGLLGVAAVLLVLLVVTVLSAINNDNTSRTPLYVDSLPCADLEPLWLQAQAVPSASLVPCVRDLPVGWALGEVTVNDGRSVIVLHHDRAGQAMEATLTAGCEVGGVAEAPSGQPGVRRYQLDTRQGPLLTTVRFDVFPGGCLITRITAPEVHRAEVIGGSTGILGFVSRDSLAQALTERSDGRLHLDPVRGR
jgi:hypothetical protein